MGTICPSSAAAVVGPSRAPQGMKKGRRPRRRPRLKLSDKAGPDQCPVPGENALFPAQIAGFLAVSRAVPVYPVFLNYVVPVHLTKKSVPRDGFFLSRFHDSFLAALRARELDLADVFRHAAVRAAGAADVFVRLVGAACLRAADGVRLRRPPGQKLRVFGLTAREIARKNADEHDEHQHHRHKVQRLRHALHADDRAQKAHGQLKDHERPVQRIYAVAAIHKAVKGIAEFVHKKHS